MDKEWIQRIVEGDQSAFKLLYDKYIDKALRTAIAITRNKELAKDAVQEAFIRVFNYLSIFDENQPFDPWFYRIVVNECYRLMKKESGKYTLELIPDVIIQKEQGDTSEIYEAILSLEELYRIPVILKYIKGFSEKEIAEILDLNQNTVKSRLLKGREKAKKYFDNMRRRDEHDQ